MRLQVVWPGPLEWLAVVCAGGWAWWMFWESWRGAAVCAMVVLAWGGLKREDPKQEDER